MRVIVFNTRAGEGRSEHRTPGLTKYKLTMSHGIHFRSNAFLKNKTLTCSSTLRRDYINPQ